MKHFQYFLFIQVLLLFLCTTVNAQLKAGITANGTKMSQGVTLKVCMGNSVLFETSATGYTSVSWRFKNGVPSTAVVPTVYVQFNTAGTDTVFQTVTGINGTSVRTYILVKVSEKDPGLKADFTYSPAGECGSIPVVFKSTSTGKGLSYVWEFGDGTKPATTASQVSHPFNDAVGSSGTTEYNVKLTITDENGCSEATTKKITVKNIPDASLINDPDNADLITFNGTQTFRKCEKLGAYVFIFKNVSTTTNTGYKIDWGDGSPVRNLPDWKINDTVQHEYKLGNTILTFTVEGTSGCSASKKYNVFIGNAPGGSFGTLNNQKEFCAGESAGYIISDIDENPPGTQYIVHFDDCSVDSVYNHPPPKTIFHNFQRASCNSFCTDNGNSYFTASLKIVNPCDERLYYIPQFYVSGAPTARIGVTADSIACASSTDYALTNISDFGTYYANGSCVNTGKQVWVVTPSTGFSTVNGSATGSLNGNVFNPGGWTNGTSQLNLQFTTPGTYTVKLYVSNNKCGIDSTEQTICVRSKPSAKFTLPVADRCISDTLLFVNTTTNDGCLGNLFKWEVQNLDPEKCTGNAAPQFLGTNGNTALSPQVWFKEPGQYKVKLTVSASNADKTCSSEITDTIAIRGLPKVNIENVPSSLCLNNTITPAATVVDCYSAPPYTYAWEFTGATPAGSTAYNPGSIVFNKTGIQTLRLTVKDSVCGNVQDSVIITVIDRPVAEAGPVKEICSGSSTIIGSPAVDGYSYSWFPATGLSSSIAAQPSVILATGNASDTVWYYLTVTVGGASNCTARDSVPVIVKKAPALQVNLQNATICSGQSIVLTASGAETYSWSPASYLNTVTGNSVIATPSITTTYQVTGSLQNGCTALSAITVNVISKPVADAGDEKITCSGIPVTIGTAAVPGFSYAWSPSTGLSSSTEASPSLTPLHSKPGSENDTVVYTVTVSVNGFAQCQSVDAVRVIVKKSPEVTISNDQPFICYGESLVLTAGGAAVYSWSPQDYITSTNGNTLIAAPENSIIYTVTGSLDNGCSGSKIIPVTVNPNAIAFFDTSKTNFCTPYRLHDVIKTVAYPDRNALYKWYINGVLYSTNSTGTPPDYEVKVPGEIVELKLVATSKFNCRSDSITAKLTSNVATNALFTSALRSGCEPLAVDFTNSTTNLSAASYYWDFGDGQTSNAAQPGTITFVTGPVNRDTTYYVGLSANNGCITSTMVDSIKVFAKPSARIGVDDVLLCSGQNILLRNTSLGSNLSYTWDFGNGDIKQTDSPEPFSYTYTTSIIDTFAITLYARNNCGIDTNSISVRVAPNTILAQINTGASALYGCTPHQVTFTNNTAGASRFVWDFGDGSDLLTYYINNPSTIQHTYTSAGTYTVSLSLSNGGCTDTSVSVNITVYSSPAAAFVTQRVPNNVVCFGDTLFTSNNSTNADQYRWNFGDGFLSADISPYHIYNKTGSYNIALYADKVNEFGVVCTDSVKQVIKIGEKPDVVVTSSDTITCFRNVSRLQASGGAFYQWQPPAFLSNPAVANPLASPTSTIMYTVNVTGQSGCVVQDSVRVVVNLALSGTNQLPIPNAFTPNGDGLNDCFGLRKIASIQDMKLSVFNRLGERIFYTENPQDCWDGNYQGKPVQPGTYVYMVAFKTPCLGSDLQQQQQKGTIVLIR